MTDLKDGEHFNVGVYSQEKAGNVDMDMDMDMEIAGFATKEQIADYARMGETMLTALVKIVDIILICFVVMTSVICLMNLGNSIGGRMAERRQEFAAMKSIGMTGVLIKKMLFMECCGILAYLLFFQEGKGDEFA